LKILGPGAGCSGSLGLTRACGRGSGPEPLGSGTPRISTRLHPGFPRALPRARLARRGTPGGPRYVLPCVFWGLWAYESICFPQQEIDAPPQRRHSARRVGRKPISEMHGCRRRESPTWLRAEERSRERKRGRCPTCWQRNSGPVDQWWKVLPRRSRDQTQATRGVNDRPQGQLSCLVLLPVC
jgi:hypothetical protein